MNLNLFLSTGDNAGTGWYSIIMLAIMLGMMFFVVILPQRRQQKKDTEMRNSLEVGDGVTTIGGIVGRVVSIKDDTVLIETGSDRVKIRFMKNAIAQVEKLDLTGDSSKTENK